MFGSEVDGKQRPVGAVEVGVGPTVELDHTPPSLDLERVTVQRVEWTLTTPTTQPQALVQHQWQQLRPHQPPKDHLR